MENIEYCEEDEAKLNPEDHNITLEEFTSQPYQDMVHNTETLFNLTATSPQKSPAPLLSQPTNPNNSSSMQHAGGDPQGSDGEVQQEDGRSDGVVNLSPFKSRVSTKERVHKLVTNVFELELDSLISRESQATHQSRSNSVHEVSLNSSMITRKKFSMK